MTSSVFTALAFATALAACSHDATCPDGGVCGDACSAMFTGNFAAGSSTSANCAALGAGTGSAAADTLLEFSFNVPSTTLTASLTISIDLGASPTAGTYSSETVTTWSAVAAGSAGASICEYSAGSTGIPPGSFTLTLDSIDATTAHGKLEVVQYVQALADTDCGAGDNETVDLAF